MTFCKKEWENQCSTGKSHILTFSPNASRAQKHCNLHFQKVCPLCKNRLQSRRFFPRAHFVISFIQSREPQHVLTSTWLLFTCGLFQTGVLPAFCHPDFKHFCWCQIPNEPCCLCIVFFCECTPTGLANHKSHILFYLCFRLRSEIRLRDQVNATNNKCRQRFMEDKKRFSDISFSSQDRTSFHSAKAAKCHFQENKVESQTLPLMLWVGAGPKPQNPKSLQNHVKSCKVLL